MGKAETESDALAGALAACARGEEAGLRRVFELEGGRMLGVARRMLGRRDLAEEAVQDALVQIWRKAGQFRRDEGAAAGWLYAILRNRALNILRDGGRMTTLDAAELAALQEARRVQGPAEAWAGLAERSALRLCLDALDPSARRSILLAYVGGFSHGEIAAIQDVPLGTAKSRIRRGLATLRGCLS